MNAVPVTRVGLNPLQHMSLARLVCAYAREAKYEILKTLRAPAAAVPFLVLPAILYVFFGVIMMGQASQALVKTPSLIDFSFFGWCAFATMMPAIFGVGCGLAFERSSGLLKLKRALPAPGGAYLFAKICMAVAFAAISIGVLTTLVLITGKHTIEGGSLIAGALVIVAGAIPFSAIGLFVGAYCSGSAAPGIANLVFLPMLWLSGLFFPLPGFLQKWVVIWPVFHLDQIALRVAGVEPFIFIDAKIAFVVLLAVTILFGGVALRRLARVG
jgi:ABC-2 type transport system permease protein